MRAIVDTNVVFDVLLEREPFVKPAVEIFCLVEESRIDALICATTVTTIDYLLVKSLQKTKARNALRRLFSLFEIATVNRPVIERAFVSKIQDFELERMLQNASGTIKLFTKMQSQQSIKGNGLGNCTLRLLKK